MPPGGDKLPEAQLTIIRAWIAGGALKDPGSEAQVEKKQVIDLSVSAGAGKPEGPPPMPEGLSREPITKPLRPGAATALAASPWAPLLAVGGQRQIALYHAESLELLGVLPFEEGIPQVLRFSRSGAVLLAGGGEHARRGIVALYEVKTGQRMATLGDELDTVLAADLNASQTAVALGGPGRVVRVYSVGDGSLMHEHTKHTDWILATAFSPDGILLATADRAGGVMVWEAATGLEYLNLAEHTDAVTDLTWRADSNLLATASEDGTVKLWDVRNGNRIRSINAHGEGVTSVEFTRDGRIVTAGRDRRVKVFDAEGKELKSFGPTDDLTLEVTFADDLARVAAGDFSGQVNIWTVDDGKSAGVLTTSPAADPSVAR
jgi:WD40 repeat protein